MTEVTSVKVDVDSGIVVRATKAVTFGTTILVAAGKMIFAMRQQGALLSGIPGGPDLAVQYIHCIACPDVYDVFVWCVI